MAKIDVESEVTGTVWKIEMAEGDAVSEGDTIMILESMKMEIPVLAMDSGKLIEIQVEEGEAVSEGQVLAVIED